MKTTMALLSGLAVGIVIGWAIGASPQESAERSPVPDQPVSSPTSTKGSDGGLDPDVATSTKAPSALNRSQDNSELEEALAEVQRLRALLRDPNSDEVVLTAGLRNVLEVGSGYRAPSDTAEAILAALNSEDETVRAIGLQYELLMSSRESAVASAKSWLERGIPEKATVCAAEFLVGLQDDAVRSWLEERCARVEAPDRWPFACALFLDGNPSPLAAWVDQVSSLVEAQELAVDDALAVCTTFLPPRSESLLTNLGAAGSPSQKRIVATLLGRLGSEAAIAELERWAAGDDPSLARAAEIELTNFRRR